MDRDHPPWLAIVELLEEELSRVDCSATSYNAEVAQLLSQGNLPWEIRVVEQGVRERWRAQLLSAAEKAYHMIVDDHELSRQQFSCLDTTLVGAQAAHVSMKGLVGCNIQTHRSF